MKYTITIHDISAERVRAILGTPETNMTPVPTVEVEPVVPEVPTAPMPTPVASTSSDIDVRGFVWDERIHSGNKGKNKDGTWRNKRGVNKALVESVEAELKGDTVAPVAPAPVAPAPAPAPVAPAPVADPLAVPAAFDRTGPDYASVIEKLTGLIQSGRIVDEHVAHFCSTLGINTAADLASRPDLIVQANEILEGYSA